MTIVEVRVKDQPARSCPDEPLVITDDAPWVDLGFSERPTKNFLLDFAEAVESTIDECSEPPNHTLKWYRWTLWPTPDQRRRGQFVISAGGPRELRVYVQMVRIFSDVEHQR